MNYWDKEKECMPREYLEKLQLRRLQETIYRVYAFVPAYREKMEALGVKPEDIRRLEDLKLLPYHQAGFKRQLSFRTVCVPMSEVVRIHSSSVPRANQQ